MNPFFLATSQRSGGHFLMSLLESTKKVGYATEYLYQLYEGWEGDSVPSDAEVLWYFDRFRKKALEFYPQFNPMEFLGVKSRHTGASDCRTLAEIVRYRSSIN